MSKPFTILTTNPYRDKTVGNKENVAMGIRSQDRVPSTKKAKQMAFPKGKKKKSDETNPTSVCQLITKGQTTLMGEPICSGVDNGKLLCKTCEERAKGRWGTLLLGILLRTAQEE